MNTCISLVDVFQILGAIATTAAVILTLWQSGYDNQKKLKIIIDMISVTESLDVPNNKLTLHKNISFCVTNIGRYDVFIKKVELQKDNIYKAYFFCSTDYKDSPLNIKVQETSEFQVFWNDEVSGFSKGDKLVFTDSTNKKYKKILKQKDIDEISHYSLGELLK